VLSISTNCNIKRAILIKKSAIKKFFKFDTRITKNTMAGRNENKQLAKLILLLALTITFEMIKAAAIYNENLHRRLGCGTDGDDEGKECGTSSCMFHLLCSLTKRRDHVKLVGLVSVLGLWLIVEAVQTTRVRETCCAVSFVVFEAFLHPMVECRLVIFAMISFAE
jgi:hypothetical protein